MPVTAQEGGSLFILLKRAVCVQEVQAEMAGKKQELCMKLAELQAHNAELRQRFQPSAQTA